MTRALLRVAPHRGTTAHVSSLYPFSVNPPFAGPGICVGIDVLAGGEAFFWDPFEACAQRLATNPNCWVLGEPGNGKSALVKTLLWRMAAVYGLGDERRWLAVVDPKGEYRELAEILDLTVIRLTPGGPIRLNPLAAGPTSRGDGIAARIDRAATMVNALIATVLGRPLSAEQDAVSYAATEAAFSAGETDATLNTVAEHLLDPTPSMLRRLRQQAAEVADIARPLAFALDKLLSRELRGMFDGPSTVPLRWDGRGIVLDLSSVHADESALPLVMVAATSWLSELMAGPGPQRVQVLDEAWALLGSRQTAAYLQSCWKLGRKYGVSNIAVTHRASDLAAQADDGTSTSKIAQGLLADSATKILLRQAPDQLAAAATIFGLSEEEATAVGHLVQGRALWRVGGRGTLVHHVMTSFESELCETNQRIRPKAAA